MLFCLVVATLETYSLKTVWLYVTDSEISDLFTHQLSSMLTHVSQQ